MRTSADHARKHPRALHSPLAYIDKRNAVVEQLQREIAAKGMASRPRSETTVRKMLRGIAALMARTRG